MIVKIQDLVPTKPKTHDYSELYGETVQSTIPYTPQILHRGYMEYLDLCWANHLGVVMTPDILWHMITCEIATVVRDNPEKFRNMFTDSPEQKMILVEQEDSYAIPLGAIIEQLSQTIPHTHLFLPKFSTTGEREALVKMLTFCDMVSPYYNYWMQMCGIPYIDIRGSIEDYQLIKSNLLTIRAMFAADKNCIYPEFFSYLTTVLEKLTLLINRFDSSDFWRDMFYLEKCGSGSQYEARGWITQLFMEYPKVGYVINFPPHISSIDYQICGTHLKFKMSGGLLMSTYEDGLLVPNFEFVVTQL